MKRFFLAILGSLMLMACAEDKKEDKDVTAEELSFSTRTIEKRLNDCLPEEGECTFISLVYPVARNKEEVAMNINKEIERFLINSIDYQDEGSAEKPEELAENFIQNYKETAREFPEFELPWEATINGKLVYRTKELISLKFNTDIFTGGAHGYRSTRYLNFDAASGRALKAEDLFTSDFIKFVEKDFRIKQEIPATENINSTGLFFENDEFHLPQNIGISEDKVILHYNAYEIAPYAAGNFILSYSRTNIEPYLKLKKAAPKA